MGAAAEVRCELPVRTPVAWTPLRRFLRAHAVAGLDETDADGHQHRRLVAGPSGPALVDVHLPRADAVAAPGGAVLEVRVTPSAPSDVDTVLARMRHWLDLDADPRVVDTALGADPALGPLVRARPGLRVPGAVDSAETALFAVLGQQVSLAAARTFQARLVAELGEPGPGGLRLAPSPSVLAAADTEGLRAAIGITNARVRALQAIAAALADGLDLTPGADGVRARRTLLGLPGIGPWTADYLALRCLGDRDAFLPGDLVLRRALGAATAAEAEATARAWSPWRAYATVHLWTEAVFAEPA